MRTTLIDGYNLLNVTGLFAPGPAGVTLAGSRTALLEFLADVLSPAERRATMLVFDAKDAPPGLPRRMTYEDIAVRFAPRGGEADELLEELIATHSAPKRLTVVSSDHRVQRAANRRRATAIDSDRWYAELHAAINRPDSPAAPKPEAPLAPADVRYWLARFAEPKEEPAARWKDLEPRSDREASRKAKQHGDPSAPTESAGKTQAASAEKPDASDDIDLANPFPPGYAEDLWEE